VTSVALGSPVLGLLLFVVGAVGGALNSVAGGGSFIVFPTLLLGGIAPVAANATTAIGLWAGTVASVGPYRDKLPRDRKLLVSLALASALGGGLGAKLLLVTSDETFSGILPFLMLVAAAVFTVGPSVTKRQTGSSGRFSLALGSAVQLLISTYGGYFGGGMGIMMLATMTLMGMTELHEMNALKVTLAVLINGVALVGFLIAGKVVVAAAVPIAIGSIVGGFGGAALARRVDPKHVRKLVLVVAWAITAWFFWRAMRGGGRQG
jgi:uncharacterized membrane protein YfcA